LIGSKWRSTMQRRSRDGTSSGRTRDGRPHMLNPLKRHERNRSIVTRFNSCALLLCSRGSTIVTMFLRASLPLRSRLFCGFYMRPPVSWTTWRRPITWHRRCMVDLHWLPIGLKQRVDYNVLPRSQRIHWSCPCWPIRYADRLCRLPIIFQAADIIQRWLCHPKDMTEAWRKGVCCLCPSRMETSSAWTQENQMHYNF